MGLYYIGHPRTEFFEGDCAIFAIALAELTGKPLAAMLDHDDELDKVVLVHAFVLLDDAGAILDAAGLSSTDEVRQSFPNSGNPWTESITKEKLLSLAYRPDNTPTSTAQVIGVAKEVVLEAIEDDPDECQRLSLTIVGQAARAFAPK